MNKQGFVQVKLGTAAAAESVYPDEQPPIPDAAGRVGWSFIKDGTIPSAKINWYVGPADNEIVTFA